MILINHTGFINMPVSFMTFDFSRSQQDSSYAITIWQNQTNHNLKVNFILFYFLWKKVKFENNMRERERDYLNKKNSKIWVIYRNLVFHLLICNNQLDFVLDKRLYTTSNDYYIWLILITNSLLQSFIATLNHNFCYNYKIIKSCFENTISRF